MCLGSSGLAVQGSSLMIFWYVFCSAMTREGIASVEVYNAVGEGRASFSVLFAGDGELSWLYTSVGKGACMKKC